jgi:hypothetical protein
VLPQPQPCIELREDFVYPKSISTYQEILVASSKTKTHGIDDFLRFISRPVLGGDLNTVIHARYFEGGLKQWQQQQEEEEKRRQHYQQGDHEGTNLPGFNLSNVVRQWQDDELLSCIQSQRSTIFIEAPFINDFNGQIPGLNDLDVLKFLSSDHDENRDRRTVASTILEIRKYKLHLGYDTVPNFLKLYADGLPSKLNAQGTDESTTLLTLLYSEIGRLNEVIEIWRHGNGLQGMERSRVAARSAKEWRSAITQIAELAIEFKSTVHKPLTACSPLQ